MGLSIVITGNPVDGLFFYGPFKTAEDANEWADAEQSDQEWWVAPLDEPTASTVFESEDVKSKFELLPTSVKSRYYGAEIEYISYHENTRPPAFWIYLTGGEKEGWQWSNNNRCWDMIDYPPV